MTAGRIDRMTDLVGNTRYCFVIMPFASHGLFYEHLQHVIRDTTSLRCIRADEVPGPSQVILHKVQRLIGGADLVLAEMSEDRPNVYYEVGYAAALGKQVLLVCRKGTKLPTDLKGLESIQYEDTPAGMRQFDRELRRHLVTLVDSDIQMLQAMLVAPAPSPSCILASPRWTSRGKPVASRRFVESWTHGDNLGVQGILYALGIVLGKDELPELLSAQHVVGEDILKRDCNLFLIGSVRTNPPVEDAMAMLQPKRGIRWEFDCSREDVAILKGPRNGRPWRWVVQRGVGVPEKDYGLVLRGPHPKLPNRQILVMAGCRSLGTGGACLAATRPRLIQEIRNRLPKGGLGRKDRSIWALVLAKPDPDKGGSVSEKTVKVVAAGSG